MSVVAVVGNPKPKSRTYDAAQAELVVVASPTYKASYTGLLKLFLDRFGAGLLAVHSPTLTAWLDVARRHLPGFG